MHPLQQITEMKARHIQDGRWCRCGHEYPCDTVTLLERYITQPYILAVQRVYRMGFDTALDFVKKYASRPDQFIVARSILGAVEYVRGLRDRSYPTDPNEQIVRESTPDIGRTLDAFLESGESQHGGILGKSHGVRAGDLGTTFRGMESVLPGIYFKIHPLSESMPVEPFLTTSACPKHGPMAICQNVKEDGYDYFVCLHSGCSKAGKVAKRHS